MVVLGSASMLSDVWLEKEANTGLARFLTRWLLKVRIRLELVAALHVREAQRVTLLPLHLVDALPRIRRQEWRFDRKV